MNAHAAQQQQLSSQADTQTFPDSPLRKSVWRLAPKATAMPRGDSAPAAPPAAAAAVGVPEASGLPKPCCCCCWQRLQEYWW